MWWHGMGGNRGTSLGRKMYGDRRSRGVKGFCSSKRRNVRVGGLEMAMVVEVGCRFAKVGGSGQFDLLLLYWKWLVAPLLHCQ